jgi:hypothetical protein
MEATAQADLSMEKAAASRTRRPATQRCLLGVAAAVLLFEIALRPFVAGWNYPLAPVREIRQYSEGIAVAHFVPDGLGTYGRRLTGNPELAGAPNGLILGDSNVISEQVADNVTMGSVAERLFRTNGRPMNVRQYGWYVGAAPAYFVSAPELLEKWRPEWIAVVIGQMTIGSLPLRDSWYWRMKVHPDFSIDLIDVRTKPLGSVFEGLRQFAGRSTLMLALRRRTVAAAFPEAPAPAARPDPARVPEASLVPRASVRALKQAYGARLFIIYAPLCDFERADSSDRMEATLFDACRAEGVRCVSVRAQMLGARAVNARMSHGFHNSVLGRGHLNPVGHRLVGTEIWRAISGSAAPAGGD